MVSVRECLLLERGYGSRLSIRETSSENLSCGFSDDLYQLAISTSYIAVPSFEGRWMKKTLYYWLRCESWERQSKSAWRCALGCMKTSGHAWRTKANEKIRPANEDSGSRVLASPCSTYSSSRLRTKDRSREPKSFPENVFATGFFCKPDPSFLAPPPHPSFLSLFLNRVTISWDWRHNPPETILPIL